MLVMFDYEKAVAVKSCFFNVSNVCPCVAGRTLSRDESMVLES